MMSKSGRYLLDTSVYSQRLRKKPVQSVVENWSRFGDSQLVISAVTQAELLFGLRKIDSQRLWLEYERYLKDRLSVIPFGINEAMEFAVIKSDLVRRGIPKRDVDIQIGATAKSHGLILATLNSRDFEPMTGVHADDWNRVI